MNKKSSDNLDFIKSIYSDAELDPPASLDEIAVKNILNTTESNPAEQSKKRIPFKPIISAAACIVLIMSVVLSANPTVKPPQPSPATSTVTAFKSYDELSAYIKKINNDIVYKEETGDLGAMNITGFADSSETNLQVEGVDEADIIKTKDNYIFCENQSSIFIYEAKNGSAELVSKADICGEADSTDSSECIIDLYIYNNIMTVNTAFYSFCEEESTDGYYATTTETNIYMYDISNIKNPKQISKFTQSGYNTATRLIGSTEYIITSQDAEAQKEHISIPYTIEDSKKKELPADCISYTKKSSCLNYIIITALNIETGKKIGETKAILAEPDNIYCNNENLYITSYLYSYNDGSNQSQKMHITKFSLNGGAPVFSADTEIVGFINNQFSMDERNGYFRVAATIYGNDVKNALYIFDEKLNIVGKVTDFAENEDIKAVRYVKDTAYVITFEETDPLFVIDLSNPTAPEIKGSVEITGFSSQLVPVDKNTILGIGEERMNNSDALKLALFDVSDPESPKVLDSELITGSRSEAQHNHKALIFNQNKSYYAIPCSNYSSDYTQNENHVLTFEIQNNDIVITNKFKCNKIESYERNRCVYVDDYIYSFENDSFTNSFYMG